MIKNTETVSIEIPELQEENLEALGSMEHVYKTEYDEGKLTLNFSGGTHNLIHVLDYLKDKNLVFGRVYSELPTLNDVFLEITGKNFGMCERRRFHVFREFKYMLLSSLRSRELIFGRCYFLLH